MKPLLSVIVPCYNEAKNIPLVLDRFASALEGQPTELILVDNNSKDNTQQVLQEQLPKYPFARSVFQPQPGYGAAVHKGLQAAEGEYICWTHADMQTDPHDTIKALKIIQNKANPEKYFIKGDRKNRPFMDVFFTGGMSLFETLVLFTRLKDINAQPNLFHRSFLQHTPNPPEDFSFDLYYYYIAKKKNYKVIRFPVLFTQRLHGESSWNTGFRQKWKFIKRTIDFTLNMKKRLKNA